MTRGRQTPPVYIIAGGVTKFAKAHPEMDFRVMCKKAFDYAMADVPALTMDMIDGSSVSYFSDHFTRQLMAGIMVHDYLGLCPKPSRRIEGGGATGGLNIQNAFQEIASGRMDCCLSVGFETMSRVNTWKGNEFIALASDTNFDFPVGGFYSGYYAMMVQRHMYEFGTTVEQMAHVSVKNHTNALYNQYSQSAARLSVADVRASEMVATPLTMLDICTMSDGAACLILASEEVARKVCDNPILITGIGTGTDAMRMSDRPHGDVILLPHESAADYRGLKYPGVHSFRGGRMASKLAYEAAGVGDPREDLDFVELHDAYTSSEIQTYEDMGLCKYGEGGPYAAAGKAFVPGIDYGLDLPEAPTVPVNPSGGLLACGHPVGATGIMQGVFAFWQLQRTIEKHLGRPELQLADPKRGAIHSHAGTGTYISVSILERP
ncbi:MAG: thiolase domain-containing protein [Actinobacteria bacterium]|nr:thiolase domain-containing protein [Actinomycetota bacterium]